MELQRDEFSVMTFNPETEALELWWSAGTASLTEERFRQGLVQVADRAVEQGVRRLPRYDTSSVRRAGLEPATRCLEGSRSIRTELPAR
jgi:hypothetical protein